jgi:cytochrome c553
MMTTALKMIVAALLIGCASLAAQADDVSAVELGGKLANRECAWCHGSSGQGFSTAPRLAGQNSRYVELQFLSFRAHARDNPKSKAYMWPASVHVDPDALRLIALYYASVTPVSAKDGKSELFSAGERVFRDGSPGENIPACVACHGPAGEGTGQFPRIAGLSHRYLQRRLDQWGDGYHAAALAQMPTIAKVLPSDTIDALASYLSLLP